MNTLTEEKLKELESLLNKTLPKPWHVTISDTGEKWTGFPFISAPEEVDKTIVHYGGFKQEHWQELSMKDAEIHANLMTSAVNSLSALISMARRTLEAEERLEKAQRTICFFASVIKSGESWSSTCQKEMDEVLGRPKAIHPPQECAPPEGTDVPPAQSEACKHGTPFRYRCTDCEADDDAAMKAMRKGLDDHSCNSTGWEKP